MTLELRRIADRGDPQRERVVLRATADVQIGNYATFRCRVGVEGDPLSGPVLDAYWFESRRVKLGDFVILYSKAGVKSQKKGERGSTSYFYYWNAKAPLWTVGTVPVLVDTPTWEVGEPIK